MPLRTLKDHVELTVAREKLRLLEEHLQAPESAAVAEHIRELSRRSIKRIVNQLKEEIARYEAKHH